MQVYQSRVSAGGVGKRPPSSSMGYHECELFSGGQPEAAEGEDSWKKCKKNPGHKKFIPIRDYLDNYLPEIRHGAMQVILRNWIDRTVRLRVRYTSLARPDYAEFADARGTYQLRVGTGYISDVKGPLCNRPCPCHLCAGKVTKTYWYLYVSTAMHIVFNTEEAKSTTVDLFYDDATSQEEGRMKSVLGLKMTRSESDRDWSRMQCVTCDKELVARIRSASSYLFDGAYGTDALLRQDLHALNLLPHRDSPRIPALIVSHPHGQSKQISLGQLQQRDKESRRVMYDTPTCPGCSGATVFLYQGFRKEARYLWQLAFPVHYGSYFETPVERTDNPNLIQKLTRELIKKFKLTPKQINYGHFWL